MSYEHRLLEIQIAISVNKIVFEPDGLPATKGDVLESIFDILGTPTELDLMFVTDEHALAYLKKFKQRQ